MAARRIRSAGKSAARAMASASTPSRAPWRSSPKSSRIKKSCSSTVARFKRSRSNSLFRRAVPGPETLAIWSKRSLTSARLSVGVAAGGAERPDAMTEPATPIRPWGSDPLKNATAISTSSAARRLRSAASCSTFPGAHPSWRPCWTLPRSRPDARAEWSSIHLAMTAAELSQNFCFSGGPMRPHANGRRTTRQDCSGG